jgi:hypothetical protein
MTLKQVKLIFNNYAVIDKNIDSLNFSSLTPTSQSRDNAVGIANGYGLDDQEVGVRVPVGAKIFTSPCRSDWLWGLPSLLSNGYLGLFPQGKAAGACS